MPRSKMDDREPSVRSKKCIEKAENREVLLKYGKNPTFYSENREDTGFLAVMSDTSSKNRDSLGQEYGLSGSFVARLLRVKQLIPQLKEMLDQRKCS